MAYRKIPYPVNIGGTGSTTAGGAQTNLGVPASTAVMLLSGTQAMTANLQMGTNRITGVTDPSGDQDAATKKYVDSVAQGLAPKPSARASTTAVLPANTYANGASGVGATLTGNANGALAAQDGQTLVVNDYLLVMNEAAPANNGLYKLTTVGTGGTPYVLTRAIEMDLTTEFQGAFIFVEAGTANAGSGWVSTLTSAPTVGTTAITFTQFSGAGEITAGNGLTKTGNTIDVVGTTNRISVGADSIDISTNYVGQATITTLGTIGTGVWNGTAIPVANGGTNAASASAARTNLATAPNTPAYWLGATNSELSNGVVPTQGTGIVLNAAAGTVGVDTTVVWTTSNTVAATNKTLTSPVINTPLLTRLVSKKTTDYTLLAGDDVVKFVVSSGANLTLIASGSAVAGRLYTIKNGNASTANVTIKTSGSDTGENSTITSSGGYVLAPGDAADVMWDSNDSEWMVI